MAIAWSLAFGRAHREDRKKQMKIKKEYSCRWQSSMYVNLVLGTEHNRGQNL